jgi:ubiquinone biosynthesis protein
MWRSLRTIRSIPRIKDIAFVLGKHGFHQVASSLQYPLRTYFKRLLKWEPDPVIHQPERLRLALQELGPTFIKFGQLLSTRPDLLPPEYIHELGKLQDEVAPTAFKEISAVIEEEFNADPTRLFRNINPIPLATASIAQVHRATTLAGDDVVLKVRKRGLQRVIRQDLQVLGLLAEFLSSWPGVRLFDPEGVVRLFERSLQRELDFDFERHNLLSIQRDLGNDSTVYVPKVYPELSTKRVLTMEYLVGDKLTLLRSCPLDPERGEVLAANIASCMLKQVFEHGMYHADPHPGNFILMPDGRVGLIDFGSVGKFTPEMMDDLLTLIVALLRRNYSQVARWILRRGRPQDDIDQRTLSLELVDVLDQYYGLRLEEIQIGGLFNSLFTIALRHGISIPAPYVLVGRTFLTLEGVVRLCSPKLELLPTIQPYLTQVVRRRWSADRLLRETWSEASEMLLAMRSYPSNLAEVLARAAEGRLRIEAKIPEIAGLEKRIEQSSNRVQLSVLVCGLMISSAILLFPQAEGDSLPTYLGAIGFVVGLLIVLKRVVRG